MNKEIFKAYDIRGIFNKSLTLDDVELIGYGLSRILKKHNQDNISVGYDGRNSGPEIYSRLSKSLIKNGINVININMVTTPLTYFSGIKYSNGNAVMITGSHNPPEYNGFKVMIKGLALAGSEILEIYEFATNKDKSNQVGSSAIEILKNPFEEYLKVIAETINLKKKLNILIDCGNGVAGKYASTVYESLGCKVKCLHCEVDGTFPNHHPDPSKPENLKDLINSLKNHEEFDIGFAFDGDADRLGVVTKEGNIIYPDRQMILFSEHVLKTKPNSQIIFDVKCSKNLNDAIKKNNGVPIMYKTGHSLIKKKMKELDIPLGGEMSGHIFFNDKWFGFDDGIYAGCRLLEILSDYDVTPSKILNGLPTSFTTPEINIDTIEGENHSIINQMVDEISKKNNEYENINFIDGIRIDFEFGFGLVRASNTTPCLVLRFEAKSKEKLEFIKTEFKKLLKNYIDKEKLYF